MDFEPGQENTKENIKIQQRFPRFLIAITMCFDGTTKVSKLKSGQDTETMVLLNF
jgi:hypothetical protein